MRFGIIGVLLALLLSVNEVMCQESVPALKENIFILGFARPETQYLGRWQRLIHTEVFRRLGIKVEFRDYPRKRVGVESDAGNIDGEAARSGYADEHQNLIRIEESLVSPNYSAFVVSDSIPELNGWDSLKEKSYRIDYPRGMRVVEKNLSKVVKKENLSDVTEQVHGLKKLVSGRTDIFVDEESGILTLLQTPEFKDSKIRIAGVMESAPLYAYLHKKHAVLVPKIAEIIRAMKAEGLIEQYRIAVDKEFGIVRK